MCPAGAGAVGRTRDERITNPERLPAGTILPWVGPVSDIPSGWTQADGNNGTMNLIDTWIKCDTSTVGQEGGVRNADFTHDHGLPDNIGGPEINFGSDGELLDTDNSARTNNASTSIDIAPSSYDVIFIESLEPVRITDDLIFFSDIDINNLPDSYKIYSDSDDMWLHGSDVAGSQIGSPYPVSISWQHRHKLPGTGVNLDFDDSALRVDGSDDDSTDTGFYTYSSEYTPNSVSLGAAQMQGTGIGQMVLDAGVLALYRGNVSDIADQYRVSSKWTASDGSSNGENLDGNFIHIAASQSEITTSFGDSSTSSDSHTHGEPVEPTAYSVDLGNDETVGNNLSSTDSADVSSHELKYITLIPIRRGS